MLESIKSVAIVEDDPSQSMILKGFIEDIGLKVVAEGRCGSDAAKICSTLSPDLLFMDVGLPGKDGIETAGDIARTNPMPVVIISAQDDKETIRRAVEAGVMAYLVKPVKGEDLYPAIELAWRNFSMLEDLKRENTELKDTLESRKIIERAKGLLMDKEGLSEKEAFTRIRTLSMEKRRSMKEIADLIISVFATS